VTAPQQSALRRAQLWSAAVATALDGITDEVEAAARRLADSWPDARGRDWTERLHVLQRALEGHADAATQLGRVIGHAADDQALGGDLGSLGYGPLLGGTGGRHVDDRRGVTIPRLNDEADGDG
jgi:hypothetical protein